MRLGWIGCSVLVLTGCGQEASYQPTANDFDKMSRMETVNSQGDGVWDDTNYQWEIQDLRNGGARAAKDEAAESPASGNQQLPGKTVESSSKPAGDLPAAARTDATSDGVSSQRTTKTGGGNKKSAQPLPEPGLPEKSEETGKSISS